MGMQYTKPSLSFEQQADLLLSRGLEADRDTLVKRLKDVNYYRLSAYWYTFRIPDDPTDTLHPGTKLATIWTRYVFDRHIRLLVMDAIERVEISIRTRMTELFTQKYGPMGYLNPDVFGPNFNQSDHERLVKEIRRNAKRSREDFVKHFNKKYDDTDLPLWMAVEVMTFGNMYTMFRHLDLHTKRDIAAGYGISAKVLESWLKTLNYVRNLCAHHSRLWNRTLGIKPIIPKKKHNPEWHEPSSLNNDKIYSVLALLYYMLHQIAPQSNWLNRLHDLFKRFENDIPIAYMGFPDAWQKHHLWSKLDAK
jgi:abortive infection bacteriophage resistance protein